MQPESESLFRRIKRALDEADIEGLLAMDFPRDEYNGEASLIEDRICKLTDFGKTTLAVEEIKRIIENVWSAQFGPFAGVAAQQRQPHYESVARKIAQ